MPDKRQHRGANPEDFGLFALVWLDTLRRATAEYCWLLTRGYSSKASITLVGDHYQLQQRQRMAVSRCGCSDQSRSIRKAHEITDVQGQPVFLDGYNVLTTVEAALSGAFLLQARDGCYRDMASLHGNFKTVLETQPAIALIGKTLAELGASHCIWLLDKPVSNSGRVKTFLQTAAEAEHWPWEIQLVPNPDPVLASAQEPIATADSYVLDHCGAWFNLARHVVDQHVPEARIVDLAVGSLLQTSE